ncbi:hypothetical protein LJC20_04105 [Eubacteriales bacterium OttesenSCG-928-M02]|nr:hypothetical protein [Eubacteriales bacterium OttesenSCG-928-M02]
MRQTMSMVVSYVFAVLFIITGLLLFANRAYIFFFGWNVIFQGFMCTLAGIVFLWNGLTMQKTVKEWKKDRAEKEGLFVELEAQRRLTDVKENAPETQEEA